MRARHLPLRRVRPWLLLAVGLAGAVTVLLPVARAERAEVRSVAALSVATPSPTPQSSGAGGSRSPSASPSAGGRCPGKEKIITAPGAARPHVLCEVSPGRWEPPSASPTPSPQPSRPPAKKPEEDCGFTDLGCHGKEAVNDWLQELIEAAARPVFNMLGSTVLGTPELKSQDMARARQLWGVSQTIANTCFVLVVSAAGILIMAGQSLPGELTPRQLLPRVVLAFLAANLSLTFLGYGVSLANGLAQAFLDGGPEKIDARVLADTLVGSVLTSVATGGAFLPLVALVVIGLAVCVAFIYVARLAITMVLVAVAPLALMFHALPMTDGLARFWWRGVSGILAIQVCQALVLVTAVQLLFTETKDTSGDFAGVPTKNDLTDLLLAICLLWVLIRIPAWVARTIWRPAQPRMLVQMAKTFLLYRGVGALMGKVGRPSALRNGAGQRASRGGAVPIGSGNRKRRRPGPYPTNPRSPSPPQGPSPSGGSETTPTPGGRPVQLTLPIPHDFEAKPAAKKRPVQLALPIPAPRVPVRPAPPPLPARPTVRSRQLMFPGMPKRPVPHRQMVLRLDPPKQNRRRTR